MSKNCNYYNPLHFFNKGNNDYTIYEYIFKDKQLIMLTKVNSDNAYFYGAPFSNQRSIYGEIPVSPASYVVCFLWIFYAPFSHFSISLVFNSFLHQYCKAKLHNYFVNYELTNKITNLTTLFFFCFNTYWHYCFMKQSWKYIVQKSMLYNMIFMMWYIVLI